MTARELPTGLLTFLFTDIEGSTRRSSSHREDFAALIDRQHGIIRDALDADEGVEVSTEGDAFFAVFTLPVSAVRGAVQAQRALSAETWADVSPDAAFREAVAYTGHDSETDSHRG